MVNYTYPQRRSPLIPIVVTLLALFTFVTAREIGFMVSGQTASAVVTGATLIRARNGSGVAYQIRYQYKDGSGATRCDSDRIEGTARVPPQAGQSVDVEYLEGNQFASRLLGNDLKRWVPPFLFGIALTLGILVLAVNRQLQLWKEWP